MKAFEIINPDFADMNLEQQIDSGCCDWCVEDHSGHQYFGHTAAAARKNAFNYNAPYNQEFLGAAPARAGEDY